LRDLSLRVNKWLVSGSFSEVQKRRNKRRLAADATAVLIEDCSTDGSSDESALPLGEA
jgi:hypothetical protein